ncbi:MAG: DUF4123 domain-containing protein [Candidatus Oceanisphaera merdipullorum]|nr:DUF4123 domain-containing protein [Candidatus Oceanisphaera merdipullorum]
MLLKKDWQHSKASDVDHWLIVDQARLKDVLKYVYSTQEQPEWYYLYQGTALQSLNNNGPLLIKADAALLETWRNDSRWRDNTSLWITHESSSALLISHLQSLLMVNNSRDIPCLLRFYVPNSLMAWGERIQGHTPRLLGPFHELVWFSEEQWWTLQQPAEQAAVIKHLTRLKLTREDEKALEVITV